MGLKEEIWREARRRSTYLVVATLSLAGVAIILIGQSVSIPASLEIAFLILPLAMLPIGTWALLRDRETGFDRILATTPTKASATILGKIVVLVCALSIAQAVLFLSVLSFDLGASTRSVVLRYALAGIVVGAISTAVSLGIAGLATSPRPRGPATSLALTFVVVWYGFDAAQDAIARALPQWSMSLMALSSPLTAGRLLVEGSGPDWPVLAQLLMLGGIVIAGLPLRFSPKSLVWRILGIGPVALAVAIVLVFPIVTPVDPPAIAESTLKFEGNTGEAFLATASGGNIIERSGLLDLRIVWASPPESEPILESVSAFGLRIVPRGFETDDQVSRATIEYVVELSKSTAGASVVATVVVSLGKERDEAGLPLTTMETPLTAGKGIGVVIASAAIATAGLELAARRANRRWY